MIDCQAENLFSYKQVYAVFPMRKEGFLYPSRESEEKDHFYYHYFSMFSFLLKAAF